MNDMSDFSNKRKVDAILHDIRDRSNHARTSGNELLSENKNYLVKHKIYLKDD